MYEISLGDQSKDIPEFQRLNAIYRYKKHFVIAKFKIPNFVENAHEEFSELFYTLQQV